VVRIGQTGGAAALVGEGEGRRVEVLTDQALLARLLDLRRSGHSGPRDGALTPWRAARRMLSRARPRPCAAALRDAAGDVRLLAATILSNVSRSCARSLQGFERSLCLPESIDCTAAPHPASGPGPAGDHQGRGAV